MKVGATLLAVIIIVVELGLRVVAHAETVLPDLARLALDHKLARVWVVLPLSTRVNTMHFRECPTRTAADASRHPVLLFLWCCLRSVRRGVGGWVVGVGVVFFGALVPSFFPFLGLSACAAVGSRAGRRGHRRCVAVDAVVDVLLLEALRTGKRVGVGGL